MNKVNSLPKYVVANGFIEDRANKQQIIPVAKVIQALPVSRVVSLLKATVEKEKFILSCCEDPVFLNQLLDDLFSTPEFPVGLLVEKITENIDKKELSSKFSDQGISNEFLLRVDEFKRSAPRHQDVNVFNTTMIANQKLTAANAKQRCTKEKKNDVEIALREEPGQGNENSKKAQENVGPTIKHSNMHTSEELDLRMYVMSVGVTDFNCHATWMRSYDQQVNDEAPGSNPFRSLQELPPNCSRYYVALEFVDGNTHQFVRVLDDNTIARINHLQQRASIPVVNSLVDCKQLKFDHARFICKLFIEETIDFSLMGVAEATLNFVNLIDAHNKMCGGWSLDEIKTHLIPMHSHYLTIVEKVPVSIFALRFRLRWKHY